MNHLKVLLLSLFLETGFLYSQEKQKIIIISPSEQGSYGLEVAPERQNSGWTVRVRFKKDSSLLGEKTKINLRLCYENEVFYVQPLISKVDARWHSFQISGSSNLIKNIRVQIYNYEGKKVVSTHYLHVRDFIKQAALSLPNEQG